MNRTYGTHGSLIKRFKNFVGKTGRNKSLGICRKIGPEHVN